MSENVSTAFSHRPEVGVKWKIKRRYRENHYEKMLRMRESLDRRAGTVVQRSYEGERRCLTLTSLDTTAPASAEQSKLRLLVSLLLWDIVIVVIAVPGQPPP